MKMLQAMMLNGAIETMQVTEQDNEAAVSFSKEYWNDYAVMMIHDGYEVAAKLRSSESGLYTIRMENACIIRKNSQAIFSALLSMAIEDVIEEAYVTAIRIEIDVFRELFIIICLNNSDNVNLGKSPYGISSCANPKRSIYT